MHITKNKSFTWLNNENNRATQFEKYFYPLSSSYEVNLLNIYLFLLRTVKVMGLYCKKEDTVQYNIYITKYLQELDLPSIIMNNIEISNEILPKIMQSKRCIDDPIKYMKYTTTLSIVEVLLSISHLLPEKYRLKINTELITQNIYNSLQLIVNNIETIKNKSNSSNSKLLEILHFLISIILTGTNKSDWLNSENEKNNWTILLVQLEVYLRGLYLSIDVNEDESKDVYDLLLLTVATIDNYTHPKYYNLLLQSLYINKNDNKVNYNNNDRNVEERDSVLYLVNVTEFVQKYLDDNELTDLIMNKITYNQMNTNSKEIILMSHYIIMLAFSLKLNPILQFHILDALKDHSTVLFQKVLKLFLLIQKELGLLNKNLIEGVKLSINELQNLMKSKNM